MNETYINSIYNASKRAANMITQIVAFIFGAMMAFNAGANFSALPKEEAPAFFLLTTQFLIQPTTRMGLKEPLLTQLSILSRYN